MPRYILSGAGVALVLALQVAAQAGRAPSLQREPPPRVPFPAARGTALHCAARGQPPPRLAWAARGAGTDLGNGTLLVRAAPAGTVRAVRCRAENRHGVALSREVRLLAAAEPAARAAAARRGGVAAVRCRAQLADPRHDPLWFRGDAPLHLDVPSPESRMVVAGEWLLLRAVSAADAGPYSCAAPPPPGQPPARSPPALLRLDEGEAGPGAPPRPVSAAEERVVAAGAHFCLACAAGEQPPPHYTWYRAREGALRPAEAEGAWLWAGGAALCARARPQLAGLWLCKAYNALGDATAQHRVTVRADLAVSVAPPVQYVAAGGAARFRCSASEPRAALSWLHNGAPAGGGAELVVPRVARHHAGVYQCFAELDGVSAQSSAELQLGESPPELVYTFIEQALRPGGDVSLRCAAAGAPPPRFTWLLDGLPLEPQRAPRVSSGQAAAGADTLAALNITAVTAADGGRYSCRAANTQGVAEHSARLDVYGPPAVRALGPVRLVAGENATLHCPYAGYPISSVQWRRRGAAGPLPAAGRVSARGAELRLTPALAADAGHYTCTVEAPAGPAAARDVELQVRVPPKISPFMFSSELAEGSSAQVLCGVSSGDRPIYFSWLKDGAPLPPELQVEEKSLNEFSLLMFSELSARHSGNYTCRAANRAAVAEYSAVLSVNVPPAWSREPLGAAVPLGAPLRLDCAATGHPPPALTWYRRIGETVAEGERWEEVSEAWSADGGLRAHNGSLSAPAAARAHRGLYRCEADNGVGPPLVKTINVTVYEPARLEESGDVTVTAVHGHGAELACTALGDAPLGVHWSRGGRRLQPDPARWTVSETRVGGSLRSKLLLRAAEAADAGEYRCHARNPHGAAERALRLRVEEPPEAPQDTRLAGVWSRAARVSWLAAEKRAPHYTALLSPAADPRAAPHYTALLSPAADPRAALNITLDVEPDADDASGQRLAARVSGLRPGAAYWVRLSARSHAGSSPLTDPLHFSTLQEAPAMAPGEVRVRALPGALLVSWAPAPDARGHAVRWRAAGGATRGLVTAHGAAREAAVRELRAGTRYEVSVSAFNAAGAGPPAPLVYATTPAGAPEAAPRGVRCEAAGAALRVRWEAPLDADDITGYDVHYAPLDFPPDEPWRGAGETRVGAGGEATLGGLAAGTAYRVWVRARAAAGRGPPAAPAHCATPAPAAPVRALAAGAGTVRVSWLAAGAHALYTLHVRPLDGGAARALLVQAAGERELWRDVRGLRAPAYEVWLTTERGPPSRPVTVAPAHVVSARVSSLGGVVWAREGARALLPCAAVGAPPLQRRWSPPVTVHALTEMGDLLFNEVRREHAGNYTCRVQGAAGGADSVRYWLRVAAPPRAPAPRLLRAGPHSLLLTWDAPPDAALAGYTVRWARAGEAGSLCLPPADREVELTRLACGASYNVSLRAHSAAGDSPPSPPLLARTDGQKAVAPPADEFVWANSSALRLNLLAWRAPCPVLAWRAAVRAAAGGAWRELPADDESATAGALRAAAWHSLRVLARCDAGDTLAVYRAPTRAASGETIGEPEEVTADGDDAFENEDGEWAASAGGAWGAAAAAGAAAAGAAAALLAAGAVRLRRARSCRAPPSLAARRPQFYSTQPAEGKNGELPSPADASLEISPYATFSMAAGAGGAGAGGAGAAGCALHTFGRGEGAELAAPPPPRPNLLSQAEYGRARSSDSESSGSPCAACAAESRAPRTVRRPPTLRRTFPDL